MPSRSSLGTCKEAIVPSGGQCRERDDQCAGMSKFQYSVQHSAKFKAWGGGEVGGSVTARVDSTLDQFDIWSMNVVHFVKPGWLESLTLNPASLYFCDDTFASELWTLTKKEVLLLSDSVAQQR